MCLTCLLAGMPANGQDESLKINGPASGAIAQYLSTKTECLNPDKTGCTLASIAMDTRVFYGKFPGDPAQFAIAFVTTDSGGSGANLMAIVLKADRSGTFSITGRVEGIFGADPRRVHFGAGHTFSYIGTVLGPEDSHANATGKGRFKLTIGDIGVAFSSD